MIWVIQFILTRPSNDRHENRKQQRMKRVEQKRVRERDRPKKKFSIQWSFASPEIIINLTGWFLIWFIWIRCTEEIRTKQQQQQNREQESRFNGKNDGAMVWLKANATYLLASAPLFSFCRLEQFWFMWIFYSWIIANFHFLSCAHSNRVECFEINAINQNQVSKNRWIVQFKRIRRARALVYVCGCVCFVGSCAKLLFKTGKCLTGVWIASPSLIRCTAFCECARARKTILFRSKHQNPTNIKKV